MLHDAAVDVSLCPSAHLERLTISVRLKYRQSEERELRSNREFACGSWIDLGPTLQLENSAVHFQRRDKGFLRDLDLAELPHLLLACLLLFQELALAGHVAAIAFRGHILAQGAHGLAGNDLPADRGLNRNLEHVLRNEFLQLFDHGAAARLGPVPVDEHGERIDRLSIDEDRHFDEIARPVAGDRIIETRIALRD